MSKHPSWITMPQKSHPHPDRETRLRRVLRLRREGKSLAEIGRELGVARQTAHTLLRQAERWMKEGLL